MYRVRSSGAVKSQGEIRKMFPNTSLPRVWSADVCNQLGIDPILESPAPTLLATRLRIKTVLPKTLTATGSGRGQLALPLPSTQMKKV
jgi:hypothetical protein